MSDVNQIMSNIKEELANRKPSTKRIITLLSDLRIKEEYQLLSAFEFYDIVGETFKLNPEFFMKNIYREMLSGEPFRKINIMEMEKYIIEKFCLYEGEQILYEFNGKIREKSRTAMRTPVKISVDGRIYATNYRVIAHGKISVSGGQGSSGTIFDLFSWGVSKRAKSKGEFIGSTLSQELPCYGYQFNYTNDVRLNVDKNIYETLKSDILNLPPSLKIEKDTLQKLLKALKLIIIGIVIFLFLIIIILYSMTFD